MKTTKQPTKKEVSLSVARSLYLNADDATKSAIEKLVGKKNVKPKPVKAKKNEADVMTIIGIEDVFKRTKRDYKAFLRQNKHLSTDGLNYEILKIGIAYLNQGWAWGPGKESYGNYWDMRGSGFVLSVSGDSYGVGYCTSVGAALRFEKYGVAQFAAKVFYPQYKSHYKPNAK